MPSAGRRARTVHSARFRRRRRPPRRWLCCRDTPCQKFELIEQPGPYAFTRGPPGTPTPSLFFHSKKPNSCRVPRQQVIRNQYLRGQDCKTNRRDLVDSYTKSLFRNILPAIFQFNILLVLVLTPRPQALRNQYLGQTVAKEIGRDSRVLSALQPNSCFAILQYKSIDSASCLFSMYSPSVCAT